MSGDVGSGRGEGGNGLGDEGGEGRAFLVGKFGGDGERGEEGGGDGGETGGRLPEVVLVMFEALL